MTLSDLLPIKIENHQEHVHMFSYRATFVEIMKMNSSSVMVLIIGVPMLGVINNSTQATTRPLNKFLKGLAIRLGLARA